jgi:hypothetical protein
MLYSLILNNKNYRLQGIKLIIAAFIILLSGSLLKSQNIPVNNNQNTAIDQDTIVSDTSINKEGMFKTLFRGKPGKAALYSLLLPGAGQLYNRKYWKWSLAAAIDGSCAYWLIFTRSNYKENQRKLEEGLAMPVRPPDIEQTRALRNRYRKLSEYAWLIMVGGHMIPVFDAYVDRHLMHFDVSPDLSTIPMNSSGPALTYTGLKFSLYLDKR